MHITYAWELGGNLGHFSAVEPVLAQLHRAGHCISICSPQGGAEQIARAAFPHRWYSTPRRFLASPTGALLGHASILRHIAGFHDESNLSVLLKNWRAIFNEFGSDIVICDFAPAAMVAARTLHVPAVAFDMGFFYPPEGEPLPILDSTRPTHTDDLRAEERAVLAITNACMTALGAPSIETFDALLRGQDALLVNDATLDCFGRADTRRFVGPVLRFRHPDFDARLPAAVRPRLRIFAYLNRYFSELETVLDVMACCHDCTFTVFVSELDDTVELARRQRPNVSFTRDVAEFGRHINDLDVVLCHAGIGTINHALAHGIPLVLLPMFREQELNAERVRQAGLGDYTCGNLTSALPDLVRRVGRNRTVRTRAADHARRVQPANIEVLAARILDCAAQHTARDELKQKPGETTLQYSAEELDMSSLDVVFLSYDEPNADAHFLQLRGAVAHAQRVHRVHGVRGFAQAHREAARLARTDRFITVDADSLVNPAFFQIRAALPPSIAHSTLSWSSVNVVNGLAYGNGGVKVWRRDVVQRLRSHEDEHAEGAMRFGFCFHAGYAQLSRCLSTTLPNGSPHHAFRAGFREAVKLGRNRHGYVVPADVLIRRMDLANSRRLLIWMSIGADTEHGLWSIVGARTGFLANHDPDFDPGWISDFAWVERAWLRECAETAPSGTEPGMESVTLTSRIAALGDEIRARFGLTMLREWDAAHSNRFKASLAARRIVRPLFDMSEIDL